MISLKRRALPSKDPPKPTPETGLPDHFSFSSMSTAQQCLRKWQYHYIHKAPPEFLSSALLFGIAIHTGVQEAHQTRLNGQTPDIESVMAAYDQQWKEKAGSEQIRFGKNEDAGSLREMAAVLFTQFLAEIEPALDGILAIEEKLSLKIPGMSVPVVGRLDLLVEQADCLVVVDAKTSRNTFTDKAPVATGQLALYAQAMAPLAAELDKPFKGRFVVFRKLKKPVIEVVDVPVRRSDKASAVAMIKGWWRLLEAAYKAKAFPPNPCPFCKTCEHQARCATHDSSCSSAAAHP